MCFPCRACRSAGSVHGEKNEEAYSRSRANRRVCHSGFGPDFRSLLCGSRYDDPYMLGGDEDGPRHENDGKILIPESWREGYGWNEEVPCLLGFKSARPRSPGVPPVAGASLMKL